MLFIPDYWLKNIELSKMQSMKKTFVFKKQDIIITKILPIRLCLDRYMTTITLVNLLIKHYSYNYLFNICLFKFIVICKPKL